MDHSAVKMSNSSLDSFPTTLFARTKRSLFRVVGGVAQLLPYLSPVEPRIVANAVKNTLFTAHGGVLRLMGTYARVRLKALRWISRTVHIAGLEHVHPHVPASAWENELVSVLDRATPYDGPVSIDPRITTAAANIALRLGKINFLLVGSKLLLIILIGLLFSMRRQAKSFLCLFKYLVVNVFFVVIKKLVNGLFVLLVRMFFPNVFLSF